MTENEQKYLNYKEQFSRLKKAMECKFYLEALAIEYNIIEDRAESILRYEGNQINDERASITRKLNKIKKIAEQKKSLPEKYFSDDLPDRILDWKEQRNRFIHALIKQTFHTEDIKRIAEEGEHLATQMSRRANNYRRAVERKQKQNSSSADD